MYYPCLRTLKKIKQHPGTDYERVVFTCKQDKKTSIDYKECGCTSTLDYELALEASKVVFKKYYKGPDHYDQRILDAFINGETRKTDVTKFIDSQLVK